jgi:ABC-2 type transport system ATP-binding protein
MMLSDRDVRSEAAVAVVGAGGRLKRLSVDEPSLEAIYTRYFQNNPVPVQGGRHAA